VPALIAAGTLSATPASATPHTATVTTVYVANNSSGSVTPVDAATDTAGPPILIPGNPDVLAATPDGSTLYVATYTDITPVSTATDQPGKPVPTRTGETISLAFSPDGKTLYALIYAEKSIIIPINTATDTAGKPIPAGTFSTDMILAPGGTEAYVASRGDGTVIPINLATRTPGTPIPAGVAGSCPWTLAITPDGSTVYAAGSSEPGNEIIPIDTATDTAGTPVWPAGDQFPAMQVSQDGKTLWALATNGFLDRINTATNTLLPAIRIRGDLLTLNLTPQTAYVGQWWGWGRLLPVSTTTGIRGPDIPGARFIIATALSPDGKTIWAVGRSSRTVMPVDVATGQPGRPVPVGQNPAAVVVVSHSS